MKGKVVEAGSGVLKISPESKEDKRIVYTGLTSITAESGQKVACGQKVGVLRPIDSEKVVLKVSLEKAIHRRRFRLHSTTR